MFQRKWLTEALSGAEDRIVDRLSAKLEAHQREHKQRVDDAFTGVRDRMDGTLGRLTRHVDETLAAMCAHEQEPAEERRVRTLRAEGCTRSEVVGRTGSTESKVRTIERHAREQGRPILHGKRTVRAK